MKLITVMERHELESLQFQIIVENWRNVLHCRSKRAKYCQQFNNDERKIIHYHYKSVYSKWYWKTGLPETHRMRLNHYNLMLRAVNFFATVQ